VVGCRFGGGGEVTQTTQLLRWGTWCGGASTGGRQPRWVAAALRREEDDGAGGPVNSQKTRWVGSAVVPILELKTKINNTKPVGLPGVLGLNQFEPCRRMEKDFQIFSKVFFISKLRGLNTFKSNLI
jgi:hypothetical protein